MLLDLQNESVHQTELDLDPEGGHDRSKLMTALDAINDRYGKGTMHVASTGLADRTRQWGMRQELRTPNYTTDWDQVPIVRA